DEHAQRTELPVLQAAGIVRARAAELQQAGGDGLHADAQRGAGERGSGEVGEVVAGATREAERHCGDGTEVVLPSAPGQTELSVAHRAGGAAPLARRLQPRMRVVLREPADRACEV